MDAIVKTLERSGHQVIEWDPPSHKRGGDIIGKSILRADSCGPADMRNLQDESMNTLSSEHVSAQL